MRWMTLEPIIQSEVSQKEKHQYSILMHIYGILKDDNDDPICKIQIIKTDFWTLWEKVRVGWFERIALKHVYYHMWNRSPVQVQCMKKGTQSQCTGTNLSDGIGREAGVGFRMGDTCTPMADCVNEWQKPPQYCKVASFQLKLKKKRILEWVAISISRGSSWPRNQTQVSHISGRFFTNWATRNAKTCKFSSVT